MSRERDTASRAWSALVNRQRAFVQLEDGEVTARRVDGADRDAVPVAVVKLRLGEEIEEVLAELAPHQAVAFLGIGEELGIAVLTHAVDDLAEIVERVLRVAELFLAGPVHGNVFLD